MEITTKKAKIAKPKKWSRRNRCPSCDVLTGSYHNKKCSLIYKRFTIK